jgi:hypothetical protein
MKFEPHADAIPIPPSRTPRARASSICAGHCAMISSTERLTLRRWWMSQMSMNNESVSSSIVSGGENACARSRDFRLCK